MAYRISHKAYGQQRTVLVTYNEELFLTQSQSLWHWNDSNVRVHAFYCVLALTLASLLQRELYKCGISISIPRAIDELNGICEVTMLKRRKREGILPHKSSSTRGTLFSSKCLRLSTLSATVKADT